MAPVGWKAMIPGALACLVLAMAPVSGEAQETDAGANAAGGFSQFDNALSPSPPNFNAGGANPNAKFGGAGTSRLGADAPTRRSGRTTSTRGRRTNVIGGDENAPARAPSPNRTRALPSSPGGASGGGGSPQPSVSGPSFTGRQTPPGAPRRSVSTAPTPRLRQYSTMYLAVRRPVVKTGEPFAVDVKLSNPKGDPIDEVAFAIQYDPAVFKPVLGRSGDGQWIPAETVSAQADGPPADPAAGLEEAEFWLGAGAPGARLAENRIDREAGMVYFAAAAPRGAPGGTHVLARLTLLPLEPNRNAVLRFAFDPPEGGAEGEGKPATRAYANGEDSLGTRADPADGAIPLQLIVQDPNRPDDPPIRPASRPESRPDEPEDGTAAGGVLELAPREENVNVGGEFEVDVVLRNPGRRPLDSVNLLLLYNPNVMELLDGDPARQGVNVDVSEGAERFSFDFPVSNRADTERGVVDYRLAGGGEVRGEGVLATLRFRALRPTLKTTFRMLVSQSGMAPTTGVFYRGQDVLGDPTIPGDGIRTASVEIRATAAYIRELRERTES